MAFIGIFYSANSFKVLGCSKHASFFYVMIYQVLLTTYYASCIVLRVFLYFFIEKSLFLLGKCRKVPLLVPKILTSRNSF